MRHFHDDGDDELFDLFMMDEMDREDAKKKGQKKHFLDNKKNAPSKDVPFGLFRRGRRQR